MEFSEENKWHVVYTRPNSEKKVASSFQELGVESFLPLQKVIRQWSDRKKRLEVPLFPNYVFVKVDRLKREHIFGVKDVVRFISIEKKPVVIREREIMAIKMALGDHSEVAPEPYFHEGASIRITHGPFQGLMGVVVKRRGKTRLIVRIDALMKAFSFNVSTKFAEV